MEKLKVISITIPFGSYLALEKNEFFNDFNERLADWVKASKPKNYRITNVSVQEITHQKMVLYSMFIAYEE